MAARLVSFVERGAEVRVFLEEGQLRAGEDLAGKAREGRMADMVLVLFSRDSLPPRWPRSQWENALLREPAEEGVRIAFAKLDDCVPPRVLMPQFDLSERTLNGLREVKRWVRQRAAVYTPPDDRRQEGATGDLEILGIALADRPGTETVSSTPLALAFAHTYDHDFDAILPIECGDRTATALAGELASQLGLRLEGEHEANLEQLREFCAARRFLVLLYDVLTPSAYELGFGGSCSTLIATAPAHTVLPVPRDPVRHAQYAFTHPESHNDWPELCRLARHARTPLQVQGRIAECYELMEQWHGAAKLRGDRTVLDESTREMVWILESWGRTEEAQNLEYRRAAEFGDQMMLAF